MVLKCHQNVTLPNIYLKVFIDFKLRFSALPLLSQHGPLFSQDLCKFPYVFTSYHISWVTFFPESCLLSLTFVRPLYRTRLQKVWQGTLMEGANKNGQKSTWRCARFTCRDWIDCGDRGDCGDFGDFGGCRDWWGFQGSWVIGGSSA